MCDEMITRDALRDLRTFLRWAWPILNPGHPFQPAWFLDNVAEHLDEVSAGRITRLVVNLPPRHGKSLLISVYWPVYQWLRHPTGRWLFISGTDGLARQHSLHRRRLLMSDPIRRRFPDVRLIQDQRAKGEFHNMRQGAMVAATLAGALIGKGGDSIVIDDPQSWQQVESDEVRGQQKDLFRGVVNTRLDDKRRGAIVLVQQRLHADDLSALCEHLGYHRLSFPAIEPTRTTYMFPRSGRVETREADQPLWPEREDAATLARLQDTMGTYAFNAQYLQRPGDPRGTLFPRDAWGYYDTLPPDRELVYLRSWDFNYKDGRHNDYTVGLVAARRGAVVYVVARFKQKVSFTGAKAAMLDMTQRYPVTRTVLVEETANGPAILSDLRSTVPGLIGVRPEGGKYSRACVAQGRVEARQLLLPNPTAALGDLRVDARFVEDFVANLAAFPNGRHDDDVDACSQLMVYLQQHPDVEPVGVLMHQRPEPGDRLGQLLERRLHRPPARLRNYIWGVPAPLIDDETDEETGI